MGSRRSTANQRNINSYLLHEDGQGEEEPPQWAKHLEDVMRAEFQKLGDRLGKEEAVKEVRVRLTDFEFHTRKYVIIHGLSTEGQDCEDAVQASFKT
jgi:hypothetical protein